MIKQKIKQQNIFSYTLSLLLKCLIFFTLLMSFTSTIESYPTYLERDRLVLGKGGGLEFFYFEDDVTNTKYVGMKTINEKGIKVLSTDGSLKDIIETNQTSKNSPHSIDDETISIDNSATTDKMFVGKKFFLLLDNSDPHIEARKFSTSPPQESQSQLGKLRIQDKKGTLAMGKVEHVQVDSKNKLKATFLVKPVIADENNKKVHVGINTHTPQEALHVSGNFGFSDGVSGIQSSPIKKYNAQSIWFPPIEKQSNLPPNLLTDISGWQPLISINIPDVKYIPHTMVVATNVECYHRRISIAHFKVVITGGDTPILSEIFSGSTDNVSLYFSLNSIFSQEVEPVIDNGDYSVYTVTLYGYQQITDDNTATSAVNSKMNVILFPSGQLASGITFIDPPGRGLEEIDISTDVIKQNFLSERTLSFMGNSYAGASLIARNGNLSLMDTNGNLGTLLVSHYEADNYLKLKELSVMKENQADNTLFDSVLKLSDTSPVLSFNAFNKPNPNNAQHVSHFVSANIESSGALTITADEIELVEGGVKIGADGVKINYSNNNNPATKLFVNGNILVTGEVESGDISNYKLLHDEVVFSSFIMGSYYTSPVFQDTTIPLLTAPNNLEDGNYDVIVYVTTSFTVDGQSLQGNTLVGVQNKFPISVSFWMDTQISVPELHGDVTQVNRQLVTFIHPNLSGVKTYSGSLSFQTNYENLNSSENLYGFLRVTPYIYNDNNAGEYIGVALPNFKMEYYLTALFFKSM
jgi:hypothetical protein